MPSGAMGRCATSSTSTSWRAASGSPSAACSRYRSPSTTLTATSSSTRSRNSPKPAQGCSKRFAHDSRRNVCSRGQLRPLQFCRETPGVLNRIQTSVDVVAYILEINPDLFYITFADYSQKTTTSPINDFRGRRQLSEAPYLALLLPTNFLESTARLKFFRQHQPTRFLSGPPKKVFFSPL